MAPTIVRDYENTDGRYVESVTIIRTDADEYPSGWKYSLHYGTLDGDTTTPTNGRRDTSVTYRRTSK